MKTHLYIVRHGQTQWNKEERIQGQLDSPLTENGINQAKSLGDTLKKITFHAAFSSDLPRAYNTAKHITQNHDVTVTPTTELRERFFGPFQGKKVAEFHEILLKQRQKRETLLHNERFKYKLHPEVESDAEMMERIMQSLTSIAMKYLEQNVLIVTHGGVVRTLLVHLGFGTYEELPPYAVSNTAYVVLQSDGKNFVVKETVGVSREKL